LSWCWGFEDLLDLARDVSALLIAKHTERSGELVSYAIRFETRFVAKIASGGEGSGTVEQVETLSQSREILSPKTGEERVDFVGFLHAEGLWWSASAEDRTRLGELSMRVVYCGLCGWVKRMSCCDVAP
jgi:hypothetical protein